MKRVGFLLKVKPHLVEEYKQHHENVWQEMKDALSRQGWHNYSLFLRDDGTLFGYVEVDDNFQASLAGMETEPINEKWQAMMSPFFESPSGRPDQNMLELQEVFHID
jgi:L-rhamnose mutarotase